MDIWESLMIWSAERSGGRLIGRRLDEGGVEARMSMAWVPGDRRHRVRSGIMSIVLFSANILLHMHPISST